MSGSLYLPVCTNSGHNPALYLNCIELPRSHRRLYTWGALNPAPCVHTECPGPFASATVVISVQLFSSVCFQMALHTGCPGPCAPYTHWVPWTRHIPPPSELARSGARRRQKASARLPGRSFSWLPLRHITHRHQTPTAQTSTHFRETAPRVINQRTKKIDNFENAYIIQPGIERSASSCWLVTCYYQE